MVDLVNDERADAGCPAVTVDSRLTRAAQKHSDDMARREYLSHTSPDGRTFDERIRDEGYPRPAAENIAMGLSSPEAVMDAWMSSDGHRRNILNCDITTIGVGVNSDGWYWTQNFGY
ncbi:CAP domain-containing protein [Prauserella flavalba]|uniref:CAP domain-containing protein n=1 Tax=Prauserella flavalba TaxID=1477506 RepID=UPI0036DFF743